MGGPEMAEKHKKSGDPILRSPLPSPARSGRVRLPLTGKFYLQRVSASSSFLAGACIIVAAETQSA